MTRARANASCSTQGCDKLVITRGLCSWHYKQAPFRPRCSVIECDKPVFSNKLCPCHYKRQVRHGDTDTTLRHANGTYAEWIEQNKNFDGHECLIWPFWIDKHGYGKSREMCIAANGPPPFDKSEAAHNCGNGNGGCVHPKHLRWTTHDDNQKDMSEHGTSQRGRKNFNVILHEADVREIRTSRHVSQAALGRKFGVTRGAINAVVRGRRWGWLNNQSSLESTSQPNGVNKS